MVKSPSSNTIPNSTLNPLPHPAPRMQTAEDKLDVIVAYLHKMDRRDKWRTIGGTIRGFLAMIPLIFFLVSAWYVYTNGASLLEQITAEAAKQAVKYSPANSDFMNQFKDYFNK
jgi:hypothetical protein